MVSDSWLVIGGDWFEDIFLSECQVLKNSYIDYNTMDPSEVSDSRVPSFSTTTGSQLKECMLKKELGCLLYV